MSDKQCVSHETLTVKIENVDEKVNSHNQRITKLEDKQEDVIEMKTLLGLVREDGKKRDEMFKEHSKTLANINENLNNLNRGYENLDKRMGAVEDNQQELKDNSSVNLMEVMKRFFAYGIPSIIVTLIATYLVFLFGMK